MLFPESEIVRKHLREPRPRLKTLASSLEESPTHTSSYNTLLSSNAVPSLKQQILFLYVLVSFIITCCITEWPCHSILIVQYTHVKDVISAVWLMTLLLYTFTCTCSIQYMCTCGMHVLNACDILLLFIYAHILQLGVCTD